MFIFPPPILHHHHHQHHHPVSDDRNITYARTQPPLPPYRFPRLRSNYPVPTRTVRDITLGVTHAEGGRRRPGIYIYIDGCRGYDVIQNGKK